MEKYLVLHCKVDDDYKENRKRWRAPYETNQGRLIQLGVVYGTDPQEDWKKPGRGRELVHDVQESVFVKTYR